MGGIKMTEQEQRIAIAEACGWTSINMGSFPTAWRHPENKSEEIGKRAVINSLYLPDYCNDLNAMHEAEKAARVHLGQTYAKNLREVIDQDKRGNILRHETWVYYTATAAQRAEAFLKTLNLWK